MRQEERELINEKFKGVYAHQKANYDILNERFDKLEDKLELIYKQTLLTNGRVTSIEKQTRVIRFFSSKPIYLALTFLGLLFLFSYIDIKDLLRIIF